MPTAERLDSGKAHSNLAAAAGLRRTEDRHGQLAALVRSFANSGLADRGRHAPDRNRHKRALLRRAAAAIGCRDLALQVVAAVLSLDGICGGGGFWDRDQIPD